MRWKINKYIIIKRLPVAALFELHPFLGQNSKLSLYYHYIIHLFVESNHFKTGTKPCQRKILHAREANDDNHILSLSSHQIKSFLDVIEERLTDNRL